MNLIKSIKVFGRCSAAVLIIVSVAVGLVVFGLPVIHQALALNVAANYSLPLKAGPPSDNQLSLADWNALVTRWNNLPTDFLARTGSSMLGDLDLGSHRVTNISTTTAAKDAATKEYVDQVSGAAAAGSGAGFYTNWGRSDCPAGSNLLYGGRVFSTHWRENNITATTFYPDIYSDFSALCLAPGGVGGATANINDMIVPVQTGSNGNFLPGGGPWVGKMVKCAQCYEPAGACYVHWGATTCASGFSQKYSGYVMGGDTNGAGGAKNRIQKVCMNASFDTTTNAPTNGTDTNGEYYGVGYFSNNGAPGYSVNTWVSCAVCCN
jgi:hypothetical protein